MILKNPGSIKKVVYDKTIVCDEESLKIFRLMLQHPAFYYYYLILVITGNRKDETVKTIANNGDIIENEKIHVMLNYLNGLKNLDLNIILKIHKYYNFLAVYSNYKKDNQIKLNDNSKYIKHLKHNKQEDDLYLLYTDNQKITEVNEFNKEKGVEIEYKVNEIVLNKLITQLDLLEFRRCLNISTEYTDQDLMNILLFIVGLRCTIRNNSNNDDIYIATVNLEENVERYRYNDRYNFKEVETLYKYLEEGTGEININDLDKLFSIENFFESREYFKLGLFDKYDFYKIYVQECASDINKFIEWVENIVNND